LFSKDETLFIKGSIQASLLHKYKAFHSLQKSLKVNIEIEKLVKMDFEADKLCRLCLKVSADLEPIFEYEIEDVPVINVLRKVCYSVNIYDGDLFPNK
jgi:hypothetical protein